MIPSFDPCLGLSGGFNIQRQVPWTRCGNKFTAWYFANGQWFGGGGRISIKQTISCLKSRGKRRCFCGAGEKTHRPAHANKVAYLSHVSSLERLSFSLKLQMLSLKSNLYEVPPAKTYVGNWKEMLIAVVFRASLF